jgi:Brp/Blh family beta-carotene 15,15'-monooxygenase
MKGMKQLLWILPCIAAMVWFESQWPQFSLWIFVGLTLTVGFAHGALDVWLLLDAKGQLMKHRFVAYGLSVVVLAAVLLPFPGIALIALLLLSLWHFGEQADTLGIDVKIQSLLRIVQGGASVMLPVLLKASEMKLWVQAIATESSAWAWPVWVQPWRANARELVIQPAMQVLAWEMLILLLLNVLLSPLLAFALFFGVYHCGLHVWRMRLLKPRQMGAWPYVLLGLTLLITWLGLVWLWLQMPMLANVSQWQGDWLRWLVVALAAVTLPHMVLVSQARARLFSTA